jgi:signal transduction histidine kinase
VEIIAQKSGTGVLVEVIDTGEGFGPSDHKTIFEPFVRGEKSRSRKTGGAGLGLSIARGFVEAHGGFIEAQSNPEGGAVFRFTLPGKP